MREFKTIFPFTFIIIGLVFVLVLLVYFNNNVEKNIYSLIETLMSFLEILVTILAVAFLSSSFQKASNNTERLKNFYISFLETHENNFKELDRIINPDVYVYKTLILTQSRIDKNYSFLKNEVLSTFSNDIISKLILKMGTLNSEIFEIINFNQIQLTNLREYSLDKDIKIQS